MALQGQTVRLQQWAEQHVGSEPSERKTSRSELLLAMAYSILFGYRCQFVEAGSVMDRGSDPIQPGDFVLAFQGALRKPQEFLQDLLALRAQVVSREKLARLQPLVQDSEIDPISFTGPFRDILGQLSTFARGAVGCAQIYNEIRDCAEAGQMDRQQAAQLLDGIESDQKRMIAAMGDMAPAMIQWWNEMCFPRKLASTLVQWLSSVPVYILAFAWNCRGFAWPGGNHLLGL
eukprot:CAMPEP_0115048362 /NCGR_PEP_ID=MMETSP0227-20121206/528_1 /TAXON_ID=89957 /ORGANISM="Polarella glacialis, Strain CCMP 1383" /LENGTH=231 /DNA_ID=CAMNT_0002431781 /DNA_START=131 /DNA_END=824 /DNA_ORIENTATION=+